MPDSIDLPVPAISQKADNWCWLAVAEMIVFYEKWGLSPTQCEILEIGNGLSKDSCCTDPSACDRPGSLTEIQRIIKHFSQAEAVLTPPLSVEALREALKRGHPVIASLQHPGQPIGHVIVIKGLSYRLHWLPGEGDGPTRPVAIPQVAVNDPRGIITETVPYANLRNYWVASIVVR